MNEWGGMCTHIKKKAYNKHMTARQSIWELAALISNKLNIMTLLTSLKPIFPFIIITDMRHHAFLTSLTKGKFNWMNLDESGIAATCNKIHQSVSLLRNICGNHGIKFYSSESCCEFGMTSFIAYWQQNKTLMPTQSRCIFDNPYRCLISYVLLMEPKKIFICV